MNPAATTDSAAFESYPMQTPSTPGKHIWAVGGGKGGIGKSFITSSIGISLARTGKRVVIIDLDLGGANLHTCLGADIPTASLTDYVSGRVTHLEEIIVPSSVPNLSFVSGANDTLNAANLSNEFVHRIMHETQRIPAEYILFDLGAGTHTNTLDFFLAAHKSILTVIPEPTSVENAYRFIKSAYYRKLRLLEHQMGLKSVVEEAMDHKNKKGIRTPADLVRTIAEISPHAGSALAQALQQLKFYLVMNQVRTKSDVEAGFSMRSVCKKYFGIETDYVGYLDYDNAVWQAVRKKRPLILEYPYSSLVNEFSLITRHLMDPVQYKAMI